MLKFLGLSVVGMNFSEVIVLFILMSGSSDGKRGSVFLMGNFVN